MKRLLACLVGAALMSLGLAAHAQPVVPPADTANCAFNTVLPTLTSGQMGRVQCDSTGHLLTSASGGGSAITGPLGPATLPAAAVAETPPDGATGNGSVTAPSTNVWGGNTATPASLSTIGYNYVEFQNTAVGGGATGSIQGSDDGGTTWNNLEAQRKDTGSCSAGPTSQSIYALANPPPLIRFNLSALSSGTFTSFYTLRSLSGSPVGGVVCQGSTAGGLVPWAVSNSGTDPCQSSAVGKSSAIINISTATTTAIAPVSGSLTTYVCGFTFTISQVITTANTLLFEQGTGTACASSPVALTGLFGAGGISAGSPITIASQGGATQFKSAASNGICAVTAIGATGSFQGVLTYVQQ